MGSEEHAISPCLEGGRQALLQRLCGILSCPYQDTETTRMQVGRWEGMLGRHLSADKLSVQQKSYVLLSRCRCVMVTEQDVFGWS